MSEGKDPNRSRTLQSEANLMSERLKKKRLAHELATIDPREEKRMAGEGLGGGSWPEYRMAIG